METETRAELHGYPQVFVCTFCKEEFATITSVFSHMSEMHESLLKGS